MLVVALVLEAPSACAAVSPSVAAGISAAWGGPVGPGDDFADAFKSVKKRQAAWVKATAV